MYWIPVWLHAPEFDDMEKTRKANLLHIILLFGLVALFANSVVALTTLPEFGLVYAVFNLITSLIFIFFYWLNQQGHVDLSIWLTTAGFWLAMVVGIFSFVGIYDPYVSVFTIVIIMASLLINSVVSFGYTILTILTGFIWIVLQPPPHMDAITIWLAYCFIFTLTAFLMWLAQRGIRRVVLQLQEKEQQLQQQNAMLAREIMERKQAETELRQHELQSHQLLEVTPIAVAVVDESASLLYLNPTGVKLAGAANMRLLIGSSIYALLPGLPSTILTQCVPTRYTITTQDREQIDVEVQSVPFDFKQQQAYLLLITDITAQQRVEYDRMKAEKLRIQIEEERKLIKLRDSFAAMVSHEFRTPLTVIQSSRDILAKYHHRLTEDKRKQQLERIDQQVKRMNQLLEDILIFSQFNAGIKSSNREPLHLDVLWNELIQEMVLIYPDHQFQTDFESSAVPGLWDESLLRHVLLNLMSNAAKYSSVGTVIHCGLAYTQDDVLLEVRDQGRGIPSQDQPRLFQPFMRASNTEKAKGTGLGLVIVKQSVEAQGGTIQFESAENMGTTFTIRLPFQMAKSDTKLCEA